MVSASIHLRRLLVHISFLWIILSSRCPADLGKYWRFDHRLYLALVNTEPHKAVDVAVNVAGTKVKAAGGKVLSSALMDAHNTSKNPQAIKPAPFSARAAGGKLSIKVPAKAVMVVALEE
jgi:alpha-L-arabinofuranosidase